MYCIATVLSTDKTNNVQSEATTQYHYVVLISRRSKSGGQRLQAVVINNAEASLPGN